MKRWIIFTLVAALCLLPVQGCFAEVVDVFAEVEAQVMPAQSAGDTGLTVEDAPAGAEVDQIPVGAPEAASVEGPADSAAVAAPDPAVDPATVAAPDPAADPLAGVVPDPAAQPVSAEPVDMVLSASQLVLGVKEVVTLGAALIPEGSYSPVTWSASSSKIVKVDPATGAIKGAKKGTAAVYATTANGIQRSCLVTVMKAPKKIQLSASSLILSGGGQVCQLGVTLPKNTGCQLYFASSDPNVVSVDGTGLLTTGYPGVATVTVSAFNGKSASCAVQVLDPSIPMPTSVQLASNSVTLGVKQSYALNPVFLASDGTPIPGVPFTVTSSNKKKLAVSPEGAIAGLKAGNYTVTVTAYNGVSAVCQVRVEKAPSKVVLLPENAALGVNQTRQMTVSFPKGGICSYTFESSDPGVVAVDANGYVTGLQPGTAVITVHTSNGKKAKSTINVSRGPDYVALNADYELQFDPLTNNYTAVYSKTMNVGEVFQLVGENEYQTYGDIIAFESTDPSIASVNEAGVIVAVSPGVAAIVARSTSGAETWCRVTVAGGGLPASVAFTVPEIALRAGQSVAMPRISGTNIDAATLSTAVYASGNEGVVSVTWSNADAQWMITGVNAGYTVVTVSVAGLVAQLPVSVTPAAATSAELRFESSVVYMAVGDSWQPRVSDEYGVSVPATLSSDNPAVVSVDASGTLIGVGQGDATVTAAYNGLSASMRVSVRAGMASVALSASELRLGVGQHWQLTAQVNGDGASANLSFASSDPAVATVNQGGVIAAHAPGVALITATAYGGATAVCAVTVAPAPSAVSLQPAAVTGRLDEGGAQLAWSFGAPDEAGDLTFASSVPGVATVNAAGYITYLTPGRTIVTGTTNNGLSASIEVTVLPAKAIVSTTPTYRLFAAYSYANAAYRGYLPFPENNARSVANVFAQSSLSGLGYNTRVMGNPSKTQLLSGISSFFADTTDVDVSIVFLCSHGIMTNGASGYYLTLPGYEDSPANRNYLVSSQEIMNCIKRISGSVILIVDSCYSGAFLRDVRGQLDAQGGRIAVLTAADDTRASYYKVADTNRSVDFFAFFMLKGLGYNHRDNWWNGDAAGHAGAYPGFIGADAAGNGDGIVTLGELYSYAANSISVNIPSYMRKSWYWGDAARVQQPLYYPGNLNDLIIYQPRL